MLAQIRCPQTLASEELDAYLVRGWFRMGQTIFTTHFLNFNDHYYSAVWLRIALNDFVPDKKQRLLQKLNSSFRTEIRKAFVTPQYEALFENYKQSVSFNASDSLHHLLYGNEIHNIYDTYEVTIYDNEKLIAVGFFDMGKTSAAGITSVYDPAYKKYSLGKYLIFLKIEYCRLQKLQYFYPGYFVPGYPAFDYKLEIGKSALQYLQLSTRQWFAIDDFSNSTNPLWNMRDKLVSLHLLLSDRNITSSVLHYLFFEVNMIPRFQDYNLFDFPVFLYCFKPTEDVINPLIIFDVRDNQYHLIKCRNVADVNAGNDNPAIFSSHLLEAEQRLFSTAFPEEMAEFLSNKIQPDLQLI